MCDYIIAVSDSNIIDMDSAKLIQKMASEDSNSTNFIVKKFVNPLDALKNNKACFAICQGDELTTLKDDSSNFTSIAALYPKNLEFMINPNLKINNISNLKTKKTYIAINGKNMKNITNLLINKLDLNSSNFLFLDKKQIIHMIKSNKIGGYIGFTQSNSFFDLNTTFKPISLTGKAFAQLIREKPSLLKSIIKKERYKNQHHNITTIGVKSVLITRKGCDKKAIYDITNIILKNKEKFKKLHPIYEDLSKKNLLEELVLPQNKEAIKAFNKIEEKFKTKP